MDIKTYNQLPPTQWTPFNGQQLHFQWKSHLTSMTTAYPLLKVKYMQKTNSLRSCPNEVEKWVQVTWAAGSSLNLQIIWICCRWITTHQPDLPQSQFAWTSIEITSIFLDISRFYVKEGRSKSIADLASPQEHNIWHWPNLTSLQALKIH